MLPGESTQQNVTVSGAVGILLQLPADCKTFAPDSAAEVVMSKTRRRQRSRRRTHPVVYQQMSGPVRLGMGLGLILAAVFALLVLMRAAV